MKKIVLILILVITYSSAVDAQVPREFNYQTVIRDNNGDLIVNQSIDIKISILDQLTGGNLLFTEIHTASTNSYGVLGIKIGSIETTSFAGIDWSLNDKYLKVEIDIGNDFVDIGTVQLLSVPFALYANDVANKDDADADVTNEIQDISLTGTDLTISSGSTINLGVLQDGVDDADNNPSNEIQILSISNDTIYLEAGGFVKLPIDQVDDADNNPSNEIQILSISNDTIYLEAGGFVKLPIDQVDDADNNPINEIQTLEITGDTLKISKGNQIAFSYDSSRWVVNGDKLYYNTGNVGVGSSNPVSKLEVKATATSGALFQVINANNDTVFAVYPDGVKVFVDSEAKGKVGGFAVSGRNPAKSEDVDILRVTLDSTRIYVNDTVTVKGKVGGFAVSGRNPAKGLNTDILVVTADSTRIFVNDNPVTKGKVGGFAVSGRNPSKSITTSYLKVLPDSTRIYVKDSIAGFGVANIEGGSAESFLNLNKQNYLIGHQTGSNTSGAYNSMLGYQAGFTNTSGSNNIFFGYKAGYLNQTGGNNVFIGTESGYVNQFTFQNTYVGYRSGYDLSGAGNTVMGSMAGENAGGGNNTFIGTSAGRIATGGNNTFVGNGAGYSFPNENTGVRNTYIGQAVGSFTNTGSYNVMLGFNSGYLNYEGSENTFLGYNTGRNIHEGSGNIFIGHEAGKSQDGVSDKLFISNWDDLTPLIYGDFNLDRLSFNGNVGVNRNPYSSVSLSVSPAGLAYGVYVDAGSTIYAAYFNGSIYTTGSYSSSDEKFKENINPLPQVLTILKELQAVSYNWKRDEFPERKFSDRKQIGFLAQEVEKAFPELVMEDEKGNKAIDYSKFSPILVEAIKEQQLQLEELKRENEELKQKVNGIIKVLENR